MNNWDGMVVKVDSGAGTRHHCKAITAAGGAFAMESAMSQSCPAVRLIGFDAPPGVTRVAGCPAMVRVTCGAAVPLEGVLDEVELTGTANR
jgi:hypothetical protein